MERIIEARSKYLATPSRGKRIFLGFIRICVIFFFVLAAFQILMGDFSWRLVGQMVLYLFIWNGAKARRHLTSETISVNAELSKKEDGTIRIFYKNIKIAVYANAEILIDPKALINVIYDRRESIVRFSGKIIENVDNEKPKKLKEWVFLVDNQATPDVLDFLQNECNLVIRHL